MCAACLGGQSTQLSLLSHPTPPPAFMCRTPLASKGLVAPVPCGLGLAAARIPSALISNQAASLPPLFAEHTRFRSIFEPWFQRDYVESLRPSIRAKVDEVGSGSAVLAGIAVCKLKQPM